MSFRRPMSVDNDRLMISCTTTALTITRVDLLHRGLVPQTPHAYFAAQL
jgi:hypothetical protein